MYRSEKDFIFTGDPFAQWADPLNHVSSFSSRLIRHDFLHDERKGINIEEGRDNVMIELATRKGRTRVGDLAHAEKKRRKCSKKIVHSKWSYLRDHISLNCFVKCHFVSPVLFILAEAIWVLG